MEFPLLIPFVVFPFSLNRDLVRVLSLVKVSMEPCLFYVLNPALVLLWLRPIFLSVDVVLSIHIEVILPEIVSGLWIFTSLITL